MVTHILLIEGVGLDSAESLSPHLEHLDYQFLTAITPEAAAQQIAGYWPDLIVLNCSDVFFLDPDWIVNKNILKIPLIVVGNKEGFKGEFPPDTIVVATHHPQQLAQVVRRAISEMRPRFIRLPGLALNSHTRQILCDGQIHSLTPKEFQLLRLLMSQPNQIVVRKR
ncbi:MAG: hypothetical protein BroJett011_42530 [Chloroflexota bacterium]|nr:MAG: hypothetical protein BroJett011_42530 [Chloroflexota bacterium]